MCIRDRLYNFFLTNSFFSGIAKRVLGVATKRSLPAIHKISLRKWYHKNYQNGQGENGSVFLFCDEFTNWNDTEIGIKAIQLLQALNYKVKLIEHPESGRAAISKGLLEKAKKLANQNVSIFKNLITESQPLVGIEPSAILSFRDEYPRLVDKSLVESAQKISRHTFTIEEFLFQEIQKGKINASHFTKAVSYTHLTLPTILRV